MVDPIQVESPQANINRARFAGKDFFTFVDDIVARIQALFVTEFNDFVVSGTGLMLIDIVSWAAETLSFYIDRQATESYLVTARTRKGVVRLARQLGYKVAGAVSASVDLEVVLETIQALDAPIPIGFQWTGPDDIIFETVEEVIFPAGEGPDSLPRVVAVRQGETRVEIFTSTGEKNQIFKLSPGEGLTIAAGSLTGRVGGSFWTEEEIITFDQTDQFETGIGDDPPTIRFGNGVAGNVPTLGSEIRVEYVATAGAGGLVQSATITDVVSPLVVAASPVALVATNPLPSAGGSDQESLSRAKANAPRVFRAHDAAITRDDYESLAQAYTDPLAGSVAVAQAFVARGADDDLQLQTLIANIQAIIAPVADDTQVETTAIRADISDELDPDGRDGIDALVASAAASSAEIAPALAPIEPAVDATLSSISGARLWGPRIDLKGEEIVELGEGIRLGLDTTQTLIDQTTLPQSEKDIHASLVAVMKSAVDQIDQVVVAINGNTASLVADTEAAATSLGPVNDSVTLALVASTEVDDALALIPPFTVDILARLDTIDALVATSFVAAVNVELDAIFDHVDGFLSADCKANLVQVPILTRDANGFLIGPPIALVRSLQTFLEARKEITQDPEVVSGEPFLVRAEITGTIGVLKGFVHATVVSNVRKAVDEILRVRKYGASLRKSDLDAAVAPNPQTGLGGIPGVKYVVFKILGPTDFLDNDNNLIIDERFCITKDTVTLVAEDAVA